MVDKLTAIRTDRIEQHIGSLNAQQRADIDQALRRWIDV
ncbi:MAG: hypothetical protein R8J84_04395 [Mariprofundales bacterium]